MKTRVCGLFDLMLCSSVKSEGIRTFCPPGTNLGMKVFETFAPTGTYFGLGDLGKF